MNARYRTRFGRDDCIQGAKIMLNRGLRLFRLMQSGYEMEQSEGGVYLL
jgi:hypothetical protein